MLNLFLSGDIHRKLYRSSLPEGFCEKGALKNSKKFSRFGPATSLKKTLWYRFFPVNLANFKTTFFREQLQMTVSSSDSVQWRIVVTLPQRFLKWTIPIILKKNESLALSKIYFLDNKMYVYSSLQICFKKLFVLFPCPISKIWCINLNTIFGTDFVAKCGLKF